MPRTCPGAPKGRTIGVEVGLGQEPVDLVLVAGLGCCVPGDAGLCMGCGE